MTTTENTTRQSETPITRRKMLQSVGATSVAVALPVSIATSAHAAPPTHPWERASRLAHELSDALGEIENGRWFAEVRPRNGSGYEVFFGDAEALAESRAMAAAEDAELVALGAEYGQVAAANRVVLAEMEVPHKKWGDELVRRKLDWNTQMDEIEALEAECGLPPLQARNDAYCNRMCEIEKRAKELPASTFAGVHAKFTIVHGTLGPAYADVGAREDQNWDVELLNEFADELRRLAVMQA